MRWSENKRALTATRFSRQNSLPARMSRTLSHIVRFNASSFVSSTGILTARAPAGKTDAGRS
jgi:hypothetical protein